MEEKGKARFAANEVALESEDNDNKQISPSLYSRDEKWIQEYIRQFGEEPSFF